MTSVFVKSTDAPEPRVRRAVPRFGASSTAGIRAEKPPSDTRNTTPTTPASATGTASARPAPRAARSQSPRPGRRTVHVDIDVRQSVGNSTTDASTRVHPAARSGEQVTDSAMSGRCIRRARYGADVSEVSDWAGATEVPAAQASRSDPSTADSTLRTPSSRDSPVSRCFPAAAAPRR
ncbi:hypothetical protein ACWD4F_12965 [Streptomyces aureus]